MTKSIFTIHTQRVQVAVVAMGCLFVGCFLILRWTVLLRINITPSYLTDMILCVHTNVASEIIHREVKIVANKEVSFFERYES
jgi:hypothetical protein